MHLKYTKEILKITKENIGQRDFSVFTPFQWLYMWFGIVGCIPEVHTFLLTPLLSYMIIICYIYHIRHIWHIWHKLKKWRNDIHHMTLCNMLLWVSKEIVQYIHKINSTMTYLEHFNLLYPGWVHFVIPPKKQR